MYAYWHDLTVKKHILAASSMSRLSAVNATSTLCMHQPPTFCNLPSSAIPTLGDYGLARGIRAMVGEHHPPQQMPDQVATRRAARLPIISTNYSILKHQIDESIGRIHDWIGAPPRAPPHRRTRTCAVPLHGCLGVQSPSCDIPLVLLLLHLGWTVLCLRRAKQAAVPDLYPLSKQPGRRMGGWHAWLRRRENARMPVCPCLYLVCFVPR